MHGYGPYVFDPPLNWDYVCVCWEGGLCGFGNVVLMEHVHAHGDQGRVEPKPA
jgi:hypothetical protein